MILFSSFHVQNTSFACANELLVFPCLVTEPISILICESLFILDFSDDLILLAWLGQWFVVFAQRK